MPKRKKYPRLHNSFGSIRYLGRNRANPYAVHPPATERDQSGRYLRPTALCYVPDWYTGFAVLTAYHAGTYRPGMEFEIQQEVVQSMTDLDAFCRRVISDYSSVAQVDSRADHGPTFADVYQQYYDWKYGESAAKKLSQSSVRCTTAAFKRLSVLHDREMTSITLDELQAVVNSDQGSQASIELMITLIKQMYRYAIPRHLCAEDVGRYIQLPAMQGDEHGVPFSDEELCTIWQRRSDATAQALLIMCYSGFRVSAYKTIEVNLDEMYFRGGVKTKSSKDRIVPIHSGIADMVPGPGLDLLRMSQSAIRNRMDAFLEQAGIERHTPHDCRHTFSRLCEKYEVREADRKRMLGHSFGQDITNSIYGHRTAEELRAEIEKIKFVGNCDH